MTETDTAWMTVLEGNVRDARQAYDAKDWPRMKEQAVQAIIASSQLGYEADRMNMVGNACGNPACIDLPNEPGPCSTYVECECGWPTAPDQHCATCQHEDICHTKAC